MFFPKTRASFLHPGDFSLLLIFQDKAMPAILNTSICTVSEMIKIPPLGQGRVLPLKNMTAQYFKITGILQRGQDVR